MAKIATQGIIWQNMPARDENGELVRDEITGDLMVDRVEIAQDKPVPLSVPEEVVAEWEAAGLVYDDPAVEAPEKPEGPPIVMAPIVPRRTGMQMPMAPALPMAPRK
jgi:hypothetical protein